MERQEITGWDVRIEPSGYFELYLNCHLLKGTLTTLGSSPLYLQKHLLTATLNTHFTELASSPHGGP